LINTIDFFKVTYSKSKNFTLLLAITMSSMTYLDIVRGGLYKPTILQKIVFLKRILSFSKIDSKQLIKLKNTTSQIRETIEFYSDNLWQQIYESEEREAIEVFINCKYEFGIVKIMNMINMFTIEQIKILFQVSIENNFINVIQALMFNFKKNNIDINQFYLKTEKVIKYTIDIFDEHEYDTKVYVKPIVLAVKLERVEILKILLENGMTVNNTHKHIPFGRERYRDEYSSVVRPVMIEGRSVESYPPKYITKNIFVEIAKKGWNSIIFQFSNLCSFAGYSGDNFWGDGYMYNDDASILMIAVQNNNQTLVKFLIQKYKNDIRELYGLLTNLFAICYKVNRKMSQMIVDNLQQLERKMMKIECKDCVKLGSNDPLYSEYTCDQCINKNKECKQENTPYMRTITSMRNDDTMWAEYFKNEKKRRNIVL